MRSTGWWQRDLALKTKSHYIQPWSHAAFRACSPLASLSGWIRKRACPPARGLPLHSTFKDFCRIPMGKPMVGSVVSQRRKSGWGSVIFSRAFSRLTSHRTKRWQFCNMSHSPRTTALSSNCKAIWREGKNRLWVTLPFSWHWWVSLLRTGLFQQENHTSSCSEMLF